MSVATTTFKAAFTGNGVTVAYVFGFFCADTSWLQVKVNGTIVGNWSAALNGDQSASPGGTITFNTAPANLAVILIQRVTPKTQLTRWNPLSAFPAAALEAAQDKLMAAMQETALVLPDDFGHGGQFLATDGSGDTSWQTPAGGGGGGSGLPDQSGQGGKFLTTDGSSAAWNGVVSFPSQLNKAGNVLKTDGTNPLWDGPVDEHIFNVKKYGALGDGVANDGPAIEAASNAAQAYHTDVGFSYQPFGQLYFPDGHYLCDRTLFIKKPVTIKGQSRKGVSVTPYGGAVINYLPFIYAYPLSSTPPYGASLASGPGASMSFNGDSTGLDFVIQLRDWLPSCSLNGLGSYCNRFFLNVSNAGVGVKNLSASFVNTGPGNQGFSTAFDIALNGTVISAHLKTSITGVTSLTSAGGTIVAGNTYHIALAYDGANTRLFVNGVIVASAAQTGTIVQSPLECIFIGPQMLGSMGGGSINVGCPVCRIDSYDLEAAAIYTAAFTPPSSKHTVQGSQTLALLNFDQTTQNLVYAETGSYGRLPVAIKNQAPNGGVVNPIVEVSDITIQGWGLGIGYYLANNCKVKNVDILARRGIHNGDQSFSCRISGVNINAFGTDARTGIQLDQQAYELRVWDFISQGFTVPIVVDGATSVSIDEGYAVGGYYNAEVSAAAGITFGKVWFSNEGQGGLHVSCLALSGVNGIGVSGCTFEPRDPAIPPISLASVIDLAALSNHFSLGASVPTCQFVDNNQQKRIADWGNVSDVPFIPAGPMGVGSYYVGMNRQGGLVMNGTVGLSSNGVPARNLGGSATVTHGSVTSDPVTFATAESDALYKLHVEPTSATGGPAVGSNRVVKKTKSTTGFTFDVEVDPGGAAVVTFDWMLYRA